MANDLKEKFPSKRQASCAGLQLKYYPEYVRDLVDVDYAAKLPEADKVWLAAFLEEHYRGWRLKRETQVHPIELSREAVRSHNQRRRHYDRAIFVTQKDEGDSFSEDVLIDALDRKRRA